MLSIGISSHALPRAPSWAALAGWRAWVGPMRLPFLLLPLCCVLLAAAVVHWQLGAVNGRLLALVLIGAVSAHVAVNALNEWFDYRSGLDARTRRTPFSGGSGTLQRYPELAGYTLVVAISALVLSALIGLWLLFRQGGALLPLGLAGLLLVVVYTPWLVRRPWLGLLAPGLGFGPLMVVGTVVALTGQASAAAWAAALLPLFLASDLLLLNQFPDVEADRSVGRRNLPIVYGRPAAAWVYAGLLVAAYGALSLSVVAGWLPLPALLGLATLPIAAYAAAVVRRWPNRVPRLLPAMMANVLVNLLTPLLVALGLYLA